MVIKKNWEVEKTCCVGFSVLNSQPHLALLERNVECLPKDLASLVNCEGMTSE